MNWTAYVDAYCERMEPGIWAEPLNAVTNLAFILGAMWAWPRVKGDTGARSLCVALALIGVSSGLWHLFAVQWTGAADSFSILIYILIYIFLAGQRLLGFAIAGASISVVLFFPYAYVASLGIGAVLGPLNGSVPYVAVALLIAIYAALVAKSQPQTAKGMAIGVVILLISIAARSVDEAFCSSWPYGTHFVWHTLNGVMLTWMIIVIHRAALAGPGQRG